MIKTANRPDKYSFATDQKAATMLQAWLCGSLDEKNTTWLEEKIMDCDLLRQRVHEIICSPDRIEFLVSSLYFELPFHLSNS